MKSHSPLSNENIPSPTVRSAHWVVEEGTFRLSSRPFPLILQEWLLSGKPQLEMRSDYNNHLWELLANFLMRSCSNMEWTVTISYLPTQQVVLTLIRWGSSQPKQ